MTHADLDKLVREILGRGVYGPQVLLPRLRRALAKAGHTVQLEDYADLAKLPDEALQPAADYLTGDAYQATPDANRAAHLARKAS